MFTLCLKSLSPIILVVVMGLLSSLVFLIFNTFTHVKWHYPSMFLLVEVISATFFILFLRLSYYGFACFVLLLKIGFVPFYIYFVSFLSDFNSFTYFWLLGFHKLFPLFILRNLFTLEFSRFIVFYLLIVICFLFFIVLVRFYGSLLLITVFSGLLSVVFLVYDDYFGYLYIFYVVILIVFLRYHVIIDLSADPARIKNFNLLFYLLGIPPSIVFILKLVALSTITPGVLLFVVVLFILVITLSILNKLSLNLPALKIYLLFSYSSENALLFFGFTGFVLFLFLRFL